MRENTLGPSEAQLQANIWKYAVHLATNKRVFAAMIGAYYLTIPTVGAQEIGIIMAAGSLASFLFEVPSGYIADRIGHRVALIIAHASLLVSTLMLLMSSNMAFLIVASVFM